MPSARRRGAAGQPSVVGLRPGPGATWSFHVLDMKRLGSSKKPQGGSVWGHSLMLEPSKFFIWLRLWNSAKNLGVPVFSPADRQLSCRLSLDGAETNQGSRRAWLQERQAATTKLQMTHYKVVRINRDLPCHKPACKSAASKLVEFHWRAVCCVPSFLDALCCGGHDPKGAMNHAVGSSQR